jgi:signal transduction histidine kinase/CHASE3 domain sensor protein
LKDRAIISVYGLALIIFAAIAVVVFVYFGRFGEQTQWVHHTQQVLTRLEQVLGDVRDIQAGQRGYLIAGDERFLEHHYSALDTVDERLDELESFTEDNPEQQERIRELRPMVAAKIAFVNQTIELARAGDQEGARAMVASRHGKSLMDAIRRRVAALEEEERQLLQLRLRRAEATAWRTMVLILFGNAFGFAFLSIGTILLGRELNRRKRLEQELGFRTERETLRDRAEVAQRRLETVVDEMPVGVMLVDASSGALVLENARMREMYGGALRWKDAGERPGHRLFRSDGTPYPAGADPLARSLRDGDIVRGEELGLGRADGGTISLVANTAPVRDRDGRVVAAVGVFLDHSELKRTELEREQAERFRDLFLSALGHDLRNPLTVISAGAASLARRLRTEEEAKIVGRMGSSAERIERMIGQLLDLTQARLGGGITIERQRTDLGEIARSVLERLDVVHPDRAIDFATEDELAGAWDRARIAEVVENLVVNALEHGRKDLPVRVSVRSNTDVILEVRNWGNPIPADFLPLIFDPFRRAAERKRMKSVGLGVGLYLALQIVRAHHGTIDVESSADAGTAFRVTLPRNG